MREQQKAVSLNHLSVSCTRIGRALAEQEGYVEEKESRASVGRGGIAHPATARQLLCFFRFLELGRVGPATLFDEVFFFVSLICKTPPMLTLRTHFISACLFLGIS